MTYAIMYRRTNTSEVWRGFLLHETKKHAEEKAERERDRCIE